MKSPRKVFIKTYGCQMNERDTEAMAAQLIAAGHEVVTDDRYADVFILNTCSVREQAEIKAIGKAGYLTRRKRRNHDFMIGIVGCMAENKGKDLLKHNPHIDFIVGPRRIAEVVEILNGEGPHVRLGDTTLEKLFPVNVPSYDHPLKPHKCTAYISIMQGCNMRCSYCIVPKTRGIESYRPMDEIVQEAAYLGAHGIKEIMLLGQIVNRYGGQKFPVKDGKTPFVQLLERLEQVEGIERIRYMSPHPTCYSDDLIAAHGYLKKLCPSVHLPMQSGSDKILKDMRRPYTREKLIEIVEKLRKTVPEIGISTDIIVGYPTETENDFQETVALFDQLKLNMAFVFKYSPREGTRSAELPDSVSDEEKERRNQLLLTHLSEISLHYHQSCVGREMEVLIEGHARRGESMMFGWTPNHYKVLFEASEDQIGRLAIVSIEQASVTALSGTIKKLVG